MASFRIKFPEKEETSIVVLTGDRITVGRLPENTIQIVDRVVSSVHAELVAEDGHYRLRDLGSTNGTFVNGQFVKDYHLREACKVEFGTIECEFNPETPSDVGAASIEALPTRAELSALRQENDGLKTQVEALREELDALRHVRPMSGEEAALAVPKAEYERVTADREALKEAQQRHHQEIARLKENLALLRRDRENLQRAWEITKAELNVFRPPAAPATPAQSVQKPSILKAVPVAKPPGFSPPAPASGAPPMPVSRPSLPGVAAPKPTPAKVDPGPKPTAAPFARPLPKPAGKLGSSASRPAPTQIVKRPTPPPQSNDSAMS